MIEVGYVIHITNQNGHVIEWPLFYESKLGSITILFGRLGEKGCEDLHIGWDEADYGGRVTEIKIIRKERDG